MRKWGRESIRLNRAGAKSRRRVVLRPGEPARPRAGLHAAPMIHRRSADTPTRNDARRDRCATIADHRATVPTTLGYAHLVQLERAAARILLSGNRRPESGRRAPRPAVALAVEFLLFRPEM